MKKYQLQVLINPTYSDNTIRLLASKVEDVVRFHASNVLNVEHLGFRYLVIPVDKMHKAYNLLIEYEVEDNQQQHIAYKIRHPIPEDAIIKHLFIEMGE